MPILTRTRKLPLWALLCLFCASPLVPPTARAAQAQTPPDTQRAYAEARKVARRERDMHALGLSTQSDRRKRAARSAAAEARKSAADRKPGS